VFNVLIGKDYHLPEALMAQYKPKVGETAGSDDQQEGSPNLKNLIESFAIRSVHGTYIRSAPGLATRVDLQVTRFFFVD
jgi:hypothetical protein